MVNEKKSFELEVKVAPKAVWDRIIESSGDIPGILPSVFDSVEIIEGDGRSVGSVRRIKFVDGIKGVSFCKQRMEAIDHNNRSVTWKMVEGDLPGQYKNFRATVDVLPGGDETSCTVKWTVEYETETATSDTEAPAEKEIGANVFKAIQGYLAGFA